MVSIEFRLEDRELVLSVTFITTLGDLSRSSLSLPLPIFESEEWPDSMVVIVGGTNESCDVVPVDVHRTSEALVPLSKPQPFGAKVTTTQASWLT